MPIDLLAVTVAQRYSILVTARNDTSANWAIHANMDSDMFDTIPPALNPSKLSLPVFMTLTHHASSLRRHLLHHIRQERRSDRSRRDWHRRSARRPRLGPRPSRRCPSASRRPYYRARSPLRHSRRWYQPRHVQRSDLQLASCPYLVFGAVTRRKRYDRRGVRPVYVCAQPS